MGLATLQWAAVSHATDDTAIDIGSYRVEYRKNLAGAPWVSGGVTDAQRLTIGIGGLECGARYEFRVRAVPTYSDRLGEWSNVVVALVASDVTPPSIPSKPIPTSRYGIVDVQWDGRNNVNAGMEPDFDHCELGVSESNGNWQYRDSVARDGHCIVTGLTAYKTYWFALRSVDRSGNKSGWSAGVSVVVQSAVSPEEVKRIQQDLADNKTALQDNTAKLDQARKDIQANKSDLDTANRTLTQAKADLSQARKDIAQTKSDLTTANGEISKAKESAAQAYAEAHSKNHTFRGPDMPDASKGLIVGDLWLKTQKYWTRWQGTPNNSPSMLADFYTYWTGTPNNSPSVLVPLSDRVIDTLVWDGSNWNHLGYADVEKNADEISKAKSDIADNAAKTTDAKKAAENAAAAAKNAQGTADSAKSAAGTAQSTADAANAAAKSANNGRSGQGCRQRGKRRRRKREEDRRQCRDTGEHRQYFGQCRQVRRGFGQDGRFGREGHRLERFERGHAGEGHRRQRGTIRHGRGECRPEGEYGCCRRGWRGERQGRRAHPVHCSGYVDAQADYLVDRHHRWREHAETVERVGLGGGDRQGRYRRGERRRQGE